MLKHPTFTEIRADPASGCLLRDSGAKKFLKRTLRLSVGSKEGEVERLQPHYRALLTEQMKSSRSVSDTLRKLPGVKKVPGRLGRPDGRGPDADRVQDQQEAARQGRAARRC